EPVQGPVKQQVEGRLGGETKLLVWGHIDWHRWFSKARKASRRAMRPKGQRPTREPLVDAPYDGKAPFVRAYRRFSRDRVLSGSAAAGMSPPVRRYAKAPHGRIEPGNGPIRWQARGLHCSGGRSRRLRCSD